MFLTVLCAGRAGVASASTFTTTLQPAPSSVDDSYLREDVTGENNGTNVALRVRTSPNSRNRNTVVRIPLSGLANRTVLRAWLELQQSAGNSSVPIDARVHPLTEPFNESVVTWNTRDVFLVLGTPWDTPGGTHSPFWSDRALVSQGSNGTAIRWQVGPIVQAWHTGALANDGFLLAPVRGSPEREVSFHSSDYGTAALRPKLVIDYTDEAPAIASGTAEIQPRTVRVNATDVPVTAWLDVNAAGATPTGAATGFDELTIEHQGGLSVTGVDRLVVGGGTVPTSLVTWVDGATSVTFRFPRVRAQAQVQLDFRANVALATSQQIDLRMRVDDTATPGAGWQPLWPGNADRVAGNGDDWLLDVVDLPPVAIDLTPDTATMPNLTCLQLVVLGRDALGNVFPVTPDSVRVVPPSAGSVGDDLRFCAAAPGGVKLVAYLGALRDSSTVTVEPEKLTQLHGLLLRTRAGVPTTTLVPRDTMFVDVTLSDGDGLQDVKALAFDLAHPGALAAPASPAYGARFEWRRGNASPWTVARPAGTSWQVLPSLCAFDTASVSTAPVVARLAFTVGRIARASSAGEWTIGVTAASATPAAEESTSVTGYNVPAVLSIATADTLGAFSAGLPGATGLPLATPAAARLHYVFESNAAYRLEARATDLAGTTTPADTLRVGAPGDRLFGSLTDLSADGGPIDTAWTTLASLAAPETEKPLVADLRLWLDHPGSLPSQDYEGPLAARLVAPAFAAVSDSAALRLRARVVNAGLAASAAIAEVVPHALVAGGAAHVDAYLLPVIQGTDTGIDRVRVRIPPGYGAPAVTAVEVAGVPVAFADASVAGLAEAVLGTHVAANDLVRVRVQVTAPAALDSAGSAFVVGFDDSATPSVDAQTASEGDANGLADGDSWRVEVVPGPLAQVVLSPPGAVVYPDSVLAFAAGGRDALGHAVAISPAFSTIGGIGTVGASSGVFTATTPGSGRVIAQAGGFADTAEVTVLPRRAIRILAVSGPPAVHQGEAGVPLTVRIANDAPSSVTLDTLALRFSRATPGDADGDFSITAVPPAPIVLASGATTALVLAVGVSPSAITAPLVAQAGASGLEQDSGLRLRDAAADTSLVLAVVAGGIEIVAAQSPAAVRPGSSGGPLLSLEMRNHYPGERTLASFRLANRTQGPGTLEQRDAELGEVALYLDDGDGTFDEASDPLLLRTSALDGALTFAPLDLAIAPSAGARLFATVSVPLAARDGDVLDLALESPADVTFESAVTFRNAWPLEPPGGLTLDGMVAAQVLPLAVGPAALHPGAVDQLALHLVLPANGYQPDVLTRLAVVNTGSAQPAVDITGVRAWRDDGDGAFSAAADALLGTLAHTGGGRWQLTGLVEPVPVTGLRTFVTVDASPGATQNATVRLALPAGADPGAGMASGNSGPLDAQVPNPGLLTVSDVDRVTLAAIAVPADTARPGEADRTLLRLALTNNYALERTLTTLAVDDVTSGPGTLAERDGEVRLLTLRLDGDDNGVLEDMGTDPVLATGFFQDGRATFGGLSVPLPPSATRQLFVTADVSPTGARDGDVLAAVVTGPGSLDFAQPTSVSGAWPLDSGARWLVDGFVAAQVVNLGAPAATVGPGDGPVLALDVVVPRNGYSADLLRGVRVVNLGSATASDLAQVRLWRDGGDGAFTGTGDDVALGTLSPAAGGWTSPLLAEALASPGTRLYVSVDVAATADSATVRLAIPEGGLEYDSANDGPLDAPVANAEAVTISDAPLLASIEAPRASTVQQSVAVTMVVRNRSAETVRSIVPGPLEVTGTASFAPVSGPVPATFDLAPGASDTVTWQYTAVAVGESRFAGAAGGTGDPSGLPRRAPPVASNAHRVYLAAQHLELTPVQTMPAQVNRGQADVVPFSLTLLHPGGAEASDVRVDRLRVRLEDASGAPIVPADLLDRVVVNEGTNVYLVRTGLETSGSQVDLPLATPAVVTGTQPATLSLRLDLSATTTVPTFRLVIDDTTSFDALDATSGAPVSVRLGGGAYPLRSNVASVVAEATGLEVTALPPDTVRAGRGTTGASLARVRLVSPGVTGISSNVRVSSLAVVLADTTGAPRTPPGATLSALRLLAGTQVVGQRGVGPLDGDTLVVPLAPPLELQANTPVDLQLVGDVAALAPLGVFRALLVDSSRVEARDANTQAAVPVTLAPDPVPGGPVTVEAAADSARTTNVPSFPAVIAIGQAGVPAVRAVLRHPGAPGEARLLLDGLSFDFLDDLRRPLVPSVHLERVRVRWNGAEVANLAGLPATGNRVDVPFAAQRIEPGDSARIEVSVDVSAGSPAGFLELVVPEGGFAPRDANTGAPALLTAEAGSDLPVRSGLGRLTSPARELATNLESRMPAVLAADGRAVVAARLTLRNADSTGAGPIQVSHLFARAAGRGFGDLALGAAAARVEAWFAGAPWAVSAALTPDSLTALLPGDSALSVLPGDTLAFELRFVPLAGAPDGVRLGVDRPDVGVVQPASALLAVNVRAESGHAFPLWTEAGGLAATSLAGSYSNFPNPFAAGRQATSFAWYMPGPGRVTLRILSPHGETVATLVESAPRGAGLQQDDRWDGRNGRGDVVRNGVYVAELDVRLDGGGGQRLRRMVAVVR